MDARKMLVEGAAKLGININEKQADLFFEYKQLLQQWNNKINLTAITDDEGIICKHFLDSLTVLPYLDEVTTRVIDVGSGAGFPGLPLKIMRPSLDITLMDSLKKRILFLENVAQELGFKEGLALLPMRAEEAGCQPIYRECYDVCVSRAVIRLSVLSEYCLPFVKPGGKFISMQGFNIHDEIAASREHIILLGGEISGVIPIKIPFTDITHHIVSINKLSNTPQQYPRKHKKIIKTLGRVPCI